MDQPRRRLSAVWFADIVGYTSLSARNEPEALKLITELQRLARTVIEQEFEGRVVKFIGDAVLAEFGSTDLAVRAAVALSERFSAGADALGVPSHLRIGVHLGEVVATADGDLYGDGINTAARLQHEAVPGQVIVSEDVWRQLRQRPEFRFTSLGAVDLRGITTSVEVYNVQFGAGAALTQPSHRPDSKSSRRPLALAAAAGTVVAIGAATFWATRPPSAPPGGVTAQAPASVPPVTTPSAVNPEPAAAPVADAPAPRPSPASPAAPQGNSAAAAAPDPAAGRGFSGDSGGRAAQGAAPLPPVSEAAPGEVPERVAAVRTLLEEFSASLALPDAGPAIRRLYPAIRPQQLRLFAGVREQFGPGLTTRFLRMENQGARSDALDIRFFVLASSSTHQATPIAFDSSIVYRDGVARFVRLQRGFANPR